MATASSASSSEPDVGRFSPRAPSRPNPRLAWGSPVGADGSDDQRAAAFEERHRLGSEHLANSFRAAS